MYFYNTLSANEQAAYRIVLDGIEKQIEKIDLEACQINPKQMEYILDLIWCEHPEVFWANKNSTYSWFPSTKLVQHYIPHYCIDIRKRKQMQAEILEKEVHFLSGIYSAMTPYEKALKLFENFTCLISYDNDALVGDRFENRKKNQDDCDTIYGAIVKKKAVCGGYANAIQYLANKCGVEVINVSGTTNTGKRHAWNMMCINGEWCHFDATWGDRTDGFNDGYVAYSWFGLSDRELSRSRTIDTDLPYPKATSTYLDYFRRTDTFLDSRTLSRLEAIVRREIKKNGYIPIQLKFDSLENAKRAWAYLIDKSCIWNIYKECGVETTTSMWHSLCDETYTLIIWTEKPETEAAGKSSTGKDPSRHEAFVRQQIQKFGYKPIVFECASISIVEELWTYLDENNRIFKFYKDSGFAISSLRYEIDRDKCELSIWPKQ